jgi:mannose/fructose/N-acetylgalactosamine-specific phosphotransferase system component IIB
MSIVLFRVDERLIHGQVVVGWAQLRADQIIVVDDALAESSWEQELYTLGLPAEVEARFVTMSNARDQLVEWRASAHRIILLTRDIRTMHALAQGGGLRGAEINIGGIHHAVGRRQVLPYVYLSADEIEAVTELAHEGVAIGARDLPASRRVDLNELLQAGKE